ncbi:MAG: anhydro-N-acetylmuramic acid kinase [Bacteroidales bacterium]|nr:anhydro-N-acetylmuramic acid kinase [Bacteroidales bacterium]
MTDMYTVTGLMSGSSLDGVDLACCEFSRDGSGWRFRIIAAETLPYPVDTRDKLEQACKWSMEKIDKLNIELGEFFASQINQFHSIHNLAPDLISSHGHTILHEPDKGITYQAGHGGIMAEKTGLTVVNDFRKEDVAQGGEGAPLVPVGDRLLFGNYDACLNLGGFANISYEDKFNQRIAYDVCPANMALNRIAGLMGLDYDHNGSIARQGHVHTGLLNTLNNLDYYSTHPPKSLGREWFLDTFLPEIDKENLPISDRMATLVEHIAIQISSAINSSGIDSVLASGGGALNQMLMERLQNHAEARIRIPDDLLVQFKEALVFALLGLLRMLGDINCLASATGGKSDLSAGIIHENKK